MTESTGYRFIVLLTAACIGGGALADAPKSVAFFGVTMVNTSPEPTSNVEEDRRQRMEVQLRDALEQSGRYTFVDTAPVAKKMDLYSNLSHCNGCDARMADELGAEIALSAEIQKTSNLILSISIYLRDSGTGALINGGSADIRGNTDQSWSRGFRYIVKNRILRK